jgi:hypothetical protein
MNFNIISLLTSFLTYKKTGNYNLLSITPKVKNL